MPYCTQCGRQLHGGEKCSCTSAPPMQGYSSAQQPFTNGYDPYRGAINQTPYSPQPYQYISYPPAQKSNAWIWAIIIPVAIFVAITLAILLPAIRHTREKMRYMDAYNCARDINDAGGNVISDLKKEEKNVKGLYIISSDPESNVAVPFDTEDFYEGMKKYFSAADKCEYFIIVRNGKVEYTAASKSWTNSSDAVASIPNGKNTAKRYVLNGFSTKERKSDTLDILYWDAYDQIFSVTSD